MSARLVAFLVWAVAAACAAYWGLRLLITPRPVPSQAQSVSMSGAQRGDIARLFAVAPVAATVAAEPALAARFKLVGVMAPKKDAVGQHWGVALISVDDKPPRAYRVGARVDQSLVLQSVAQRSVAIGPSQGDAAFKLELSTPTAAATGALPSAQTILGAGTLPAGVPPAGSAPAAAGANRFNAPPPGLTMPRAPILADPPPGGVPFGTRAPATDPLNDPSTRR